MLAPVPSPAAWGNVDVQPDPDLAWMDAQLGAQQEDSETWLLESPPSSAAPPGFNQAAATASTCSSGREVLPPPRLPSEQLHQIRGRQTEAQHVQQQPWQRSTRCGSSAEHGALLGLPSKRHSSSGSPASLRGSAYPSRAPAAAGRHVAYGRLRQPAAAAARRLSGLSVSTAASSLDQSTISSGDCTSSTAAAPAGTAAAKSAKPVWGPGRPPVAASAIPSQRDAMPGPLTSLQAPRPLAATAMPPLRGAQPAPSTGTERAQGQLSPSSKVSSWLQSSAFSASALITKPLPASGSSAAEPAQQSLLDSPHVGSSSEGSWRIAVPPRSSGAAAPEPSQPSGVSRIPKPGAVAAAAPAEAAGPSWPASSTAPDRQRSEQNQHAQLVSAAGGSSCSPPVLPPVHIRRGSALPSGSLGMLGREESPAGRLPESLVAESHTPFSGEPIKTSGLCLSGCQHLLQSRTAKQACLNPTL